MNGQTEEQIQRRVAAIYESVHGKPYCPTCQGTGSLSKWVVVDNPPWPKSTPVPYYAGPCPDCNGERDPGEAMGRRLRASGLEAVWRDSYTFETWVVARQPAMAGVVRQVRAWADHPAGTLVLAGGPGRGKTHLAIAAAIVTIGNGLLVRFIESAVLLDKLRKAISNNTYAAVYEQYVEEPNVLVLDDLKAEHQTDYGSATLDELIAWRLLHERPMLITTNVGPADVSERMRSRFSDATRVSLLKCEGVDMRPTQRDA